MDLYRLARPLLFRLPAESAHEAALWAGRLMQALGHKAPALPPRLGCRCLGLTLQSPVGLAAGVDKNALLVPYFASLGLGFIEVGSVTARPAAGNQRPRAFRLPRDQALVNRMGLPNQGAEAVAPRLSSGGAVPVWVNLAATPGTQDAVADFVASLRLLAPRADVVTLNLSCPNTEDGRAFSHPQALARLLAAVFAAQKEVAPQVPVVLKLPPAPPQGPDLDGLRRLHEVAVEHGAAGICAGNTAPDRTGLATDPGEVAAVGAGGLSGRPLYPRTLAQVRALYQIGQGSGRPLPIIALGGIDSGERAYEAVRAGASLVQLYTALVYKGPSLPMQMANELDLLLARDGLQSIEEAIGQGA